MRFHFGLILFLAAFSLNAVPALADVTRTCSAQIKARANGKTEIIASINGVGHCRNANHADDCRIQARKANEACLAAVWPSRDANGPPVECRSFAGGGRPFAELTYQGVYLTPNSKRYLNRLAYAACCRLAPKKDFVTLSVNAQKWGKNHCAGRRVGKDHYQDDSEFVHGPVNFDCKKRRQEGICG